MIKCIQYVYYQRPQYGKEYSPKIKFAYPEKGDLLPRLGDPVAIWRVKQVPTMKKLYRMIKNICKLLKQSY